MKKPPGVWPGGSSGVERRCVRGLRCAGIYARRDSVVKSASRRFQLELLFQHPAFQTGIHAFHQPLS